MTDNKTAPAIIPKEQLTAYERWELPNVETINESDNGSRPAEDIPIASEQELAAIKEQAYEQGYQQGHEQGLTNGAVEIRQRVAELDAILAYQSKPLAALEQEIESYLLDIVKNLVKSVVRYELQCQPEHIVKIVHEAIALLPMNKRPLNVYLNQDDCEFIKQHLNEAEYRQWQLIADASLARGGCRIEVDDSQVDASLEARMQAAFDHLFTIDNV